MESYAEYTKRLIEEARRRAAGQRATRKVQADVESEVGRLKRMLEEEVQRRKKP